MVGFAVALALLLFGYRMADTTIGRLPDHRGFFLVDVEDRVDARALGFVRPRRVYFVLIDGLRADFARSSAWSARLAANGQCRETRLRLPTVSRPMYAVYSTGAEQDRTGSRNNDETRPL